MVSESLRQVTHRYHLLKRRSQGAPSSHLARVTGRLMASIRSPEEGEAEQEEDEPLALPLEEPDCQDPGLQAPTPQPPAKASTSSSPDQEKHSFPDHVAALSEY
ncbi:hypothetical protein ABG768_021942 [Culter alburnus]|uniref:Uncharacterized protein n=1 Tax=Culter alburnus TaxID=194366 RepID=A0AAW2AVG9_CULAL